MTNPDEQLARYLGGNVTTLQRKKQLREELRRRIEAHPDGDTESVVREIGKFVEERPLIRTVAIFSALPGEVDLRSLCSKDERIWVLPKVVGDELVFHRVRSFDHDVAPGAYGIREPRDDLEKVDVGKIDLFLCPGLGFDLKGGRIGRGKGYYDRILEKARPDAVKLGVCFGWQLVEEVEMEDHDIRMNGVIAG